MKNDERYRAGRSTCEPRGAILWKSFPETSHLRTAHATILLTSWFHAFAAQTLRANGCAPSKPLDPPAGAECQARRRVAAELAVAPMRALELDGPAVIEPAAKVA